MRRLPARVKNAMTAKTPTTASTSSSWSSADISALCGALAGRVDLGDERRAHAVRELALVVGVEDDDVGAPPGDQRAGTIAAAKGVRRVDRGRDDRLVRRETAERYAERDRGRHALERRRPGVVIRREGDRHARRDETPGVGRRVADEERAARKEHRGDLLARERAHAVGRGVGDVVRRARADPRRERGGTDVVQLIGVEGDREAGLLRPREERTDLVDAADTLPDEGAPRLPEPL